MRRIGEGILLAEWFIVVFFGAASGTLVGFILAALATAGFAYYKWRMVAGS